MGKNIDETSLTTHTEDLTQQIVNETAPDKLKDLTELFNLNQSKKNVLRILKLNGLLDKVSDEMVKRFENTPGNFSNKDLLDYFNITQTAIDKATKNLESVENLNPIQLQQNNQYNITVDSSIDRESREKVLDIVNQLLESSEHDENNKVD